VARSKSTLPGGVRVADLVTLGVLADYVRSEDVKAVVREAGRESQRDRQLAADLVVLYVIALSLYRDVAYEEVLSLMMEGLRWLGLPDRKLATKGGITQARLRLGAEPLRLLFEKLAEPLCSPGTQGGFYRSWRTVAWDGSTLTVPDSKENAEAFGYAGDPALASYPLIRCVCLCETGTHALLGAAMGPYRTSEQELARKVIPRLKPDMLLIADREYLVLDFWEECLKTGAALLWRVTKSWKLAKNQMLKDGSWLSTIRSPQGRGPRKERTVRVIQYEVEGSDDVYRLVTSILDPDEAPAGELAQIYTQRWEVEGVFDEMKTHLKGARMLLRSKKPELVEQEFWGLLIAHRAIRSLIHDAALAHNKDPDEVSFVSSVRIVRRTLPSRADFSP
jgi:hypothetical protein